MVTTGMGITPSLACITLLLSEKIEQLADKLTGTLSQQRQCAQQRERGETDFLQQSSRCMTVGDFRLAGLQGWQGVDCPPQGNGEQRNQGAEGEGDSTSVQLGKHTEGRHIRRRPGEQKCEGGAR